MALRWKFNREILSTQRGRINRLASLVAYWWHGPLRVWRGPLTFLFVVLTCCFLDGPGSGLAFDYLEKFAQDARSRMYDVVHVSLAEQARKEILMVTINDDTFHKLPGPPLPRDYHAKVIRDLTRAGAKVIAFDLIFDLPSKNDKSFIAAARASHRVLWGCLFENQGQSDERMIQPIAPLLQASPYEGHIVFPQNGAQMRIDSIDPVLRYHNQLVPSFSLQASMMALGIDAAQLHRTPKGWQAGTMFIPVGADGRSLINYVGHNASAFGSVHSADVDNGGVTLEEFSSIPYEDIYNGAVDKKWYKEHQYFKNKIILIGDVTTVGGDHRFTPIGDMSGMEIHAHAIATYLQNGFISEPPQWVNYGVILVLTALIWPLAARLSLVRAWQMTFLLGVIYFGINILIYTDFRILVHMVGPLVALLSMGLGTITQRSFGEEREKQRMQGLLHRYVSPQVAKFIINNPDKCFLGSGEEVVATVMFSDIRGFTALSEDMSAEQMVARLNEYFQMMTKVVFAYEATVDKFMGDAMMVIFGAPMPQANHAERAVKAAVEMQHELSLLKLKWAREGEAPFDIGIGIHTGAMVVGNIGADERLDFTAIGDTVNLACRVEGLTKQHGCGILITEETYNIVRGKVKARGPIVSPVIGRKAQAVVYEVYEWLDG